MFSKVKPDLYVKNLLDIPIGRLESMGIRGIIIDLDNTLTNWNCTEIKPVVCGWLDNLQKMGFKICVVSNNSAQRIDASLKGLQIPYVSNAYKPGKRAFLQAMKILNTDQASTVVIGDQLFTDVLGGKRVGVATILVIPLSTREFMGTKIMRKLEKIVLKKIFKNEFLCRNKE